MCYDQITSFDIYTRTQLFKKEDFWTVLSADIDNKEYAIYLEINDRFKFKNFGEYCKFYNMLDNYLLADVMIQFSDLMYENYTLDPLYYNTLPGYAVDAFLYNHKPQVALLMIQRMYEDYEEHKRGGLSFSMKRYVDIKNR
jgi:hypothetical protein